MARSLLTAAPRGLRSRFTDRVPGGRWSLDPQPGSWGWVLSSLSSADIWPRKPWPGSTGSPVLSWPSSEPLYCSKSWF